MFQEILALTVVTAAVFYMIYGIYNSVFVKNENNSVCAGCEVGSCNTKK